MELGQEAEECTVVGLRPRLIPYPLKIPLFALNPPQTTQTQTQTQSSLSEFTWLPSFYFYSRVAPRSFMYNTPKHYVNERDCTFHGESHTYTHTQIKLYKNRVMKISFITQIYIFYFFTYILLYVQSRFSPASFFLMSFKKRKRKEKK